MTNFSGGSLHKCDKCQEITRHRFGKCLQCAARPKGKFFSRNGEIPHSIADSSGGILNVPIDNEETDTDDELLE